MVLFSQNKLALPAQTRHLAAIRYAIRRRGVSPRAPKMNVPARRRIRPHPRRYTPARLVPSTPPVITVEWTATNTLVAADASRFATRPIA